MPVLAGFLLVALVVVIVLIVILHNHKRLKSIKLPIFGIEATFYKD